MIFEILLIIINFQISRIEIYQPEFEQMRVTCYCTGTRFANGESVYEGGCAGRRADIGKYVVIRTDQDEHILKITDCGGYLIESGQRIDVYRTTLARCYDWVHQYGDYQEIAILTEDELLLYQENFRKSQELEELYQLKSEVLEMARLENQIKVDIVNHLSELIKRLEYASEYSFYIGDKLIQYKESVNFIFINDIPTIATALNIPYKKEEVNYPNATFRYSFEFYGYEFIEITDKEYERKVN